MTDQPPEDPASGDRRRGASAGARSALRFFLHALIIAISVPLALVLAQWLHAALGLPGS